MVIEHAELSIPAGREAEFEAAFARAHQIITQAPGCRWARIVRQVEDPSAYLLLVGWESVEAHTEGFRGSELFQQWRGVVGEFFAAPPVVTHYAGDIKANELP